MWSTTLSRTIWPNRQMTFQTRGVCRPAVTLKDRTFWRPINRRGRQQLTTRIRQWGKRERTPSVIKITIEWPRQHRPHESQTIRVPIWVKASICRSTAQSHTRCSRSWRWRIGSGVICRSAWKLCRLSRNMLLLIKEVDAVSAPLKTPKSRTATKTMSTHSTVALIFRAFARTRAKRPWPLSSRMLSGQVPTTSTNWRRRRNWWAWSKITPLVTGTKSSWKDCRLVFAQSKVKMMTIKTSPSSMNTWTKCMSSLRRRNWPCWKTKSSRKASKCHGKHSRIIFSMIKKSFGSMNANATLTMALCWTKWGWDRVWKLRRKCRNLQTTIESILRSICASVNRLC